MDVVAFVKTRSQSAKLMQKTDGLFHHIANHTQAAAMRRVATGNFRLDAALFSCGGADRNRRRDLR